LTAQAIVIMGVSGTGKSSVGRVLADRIGWRFLDADDYHPPANVAKMRAGQPLGDDDRWPWLDTLAAAVAERLGARQSVVMACSALKSAYRQRLRVDGGRVLFVWLHAPRDLIADRLASRDGHFMPPDLLDSQLATLEEPRRALEVDIDRPVDEIASAIIDSLGLVPEWPGQSG
jgi:gluconokinase